jgi:glutathione-regulated potassium-efflux system ancillary protein KefG
MSRVLVLFAHPALEKSRVHKRLISSVPQRSDVRFHDLYQAYPRLDIDVAYEQQLLLTHDVIVFQFPFYWYSTPPLLKQWQDLVLQHGWAYGSSGSALAGKSWLCVVSAGGPASAYAPGGYNGLTVRQLLAPLERTAVLCGMHFLPPWVVFGTHRLRQAGIERAGRAYNRLLLRLADGSPEEVEELSSRFDTVDVLSMDTGDDRRQEP